MRVNGLVHLLRRKDRTFELTYAPLGALARNGSYCVYEVRLPEAQVREHGLGTAWSLSRSRAAVVAVF